MSIMGKEQFFSLVLVHLSEKVYLACFTFWKKKMCHCFKKKKKKKPQKDFRGKKKNTIVNGIKFLYGSTAFYRHKNLRILQLQLHQQLYLLWEYTSI